MIQFSQRKSLIRQIQGFLGITQDGIDGGQTWSAIIRSIVGQNAVDAIRIPPHSGVYFIGRSNAVAAAQRKLGITVDGRDGAQTWAAISEYLRPKPIQLPAHPPEGKYPESVRGRSPNRNAGLNECKGIVIHHAAGYFEGTIDWCLKPKTHAAYHCLVAEDGTRAILGKDTDQLHHAGESTWKGRKGCNAFMLGIAFCGDTNTGAMRKSARLSPQEVESACEWIRAKMERYGLKKADITYHRVVSPGRKDDTSREAYEQIMNAL